MTSLADAFNANYEIGQAVKYYPVLQGKKYIETVTTTRAYISNGHAVIKIAARPVSVTLHAVHAYNPRCTCDLKDSPTAPASWHAETCHEHQKSESDGM
jgi:hypothetical protein